MATAKLKQFNAQTFRFWTVAIYLFLVAAVGTYFLPFVGVELPVIGKKSWSVRSVVKTIPKGFQSQGKSNLKMSQKFDFIDFVKELTPPKQEGRGLPKGIVNVVLGVLVPIAAAVAYLALILGLFLAPLKRSGVFLFTSGVAVVCAMYVVLAVFYFNTAMQGAFSDTLLKTKDSPFFFITKNLVQEVSIRPDTGLIALVSLAAIIFLAGLLRMSRANTA